MDQERRVGIVRKTVSLTWGQGEGEERQREKSGRVWSLCPPYSTLSLLLLPGLHKEETEFQPSKGGSGGAGAQPGILSRPLGLQAHHHPSRTSSKTKLLPPP